MKRANPTWKTRDRLIRLDTVRLMGVVNITPDSFYDGGRFFAPAAAAARAVELVAQGADLLDLGAESSRPGAEPVSTQEELERLLPVLKEVRRLVAVPISVDTYKSAVARAALAEGADIVNDISALKFDPQMASTVAAFRAGLVLMHMRGTPRDMQQIPPAEDILAEINDDLAVSLRLASEAGIDRDRIVLDPGVGFGKTLVDNLRILNRLHFLRDFNLPILVGTSRKSFIGRLLGVPEEERLLGTAASVAIAVLRGAHLVRVHDVEEMKMVVQVAEAIAQERSAIC